MQIKVQRLREAMMLLTPAIPRRTPSEILKYVLLMDHKASATDATVNVMVDLPEVEGAYLLPHKEVSDLLKYLPANELITIEKQDGSVVLSGESGTASYPAKSLADYPIHEGYQLYVKGPFNGDLLVRTLNELLPYALDDESKPILRGITLLLGEPVQAWAADGFRLANKNLKDSYPAEESIVIPPEAIKAINYLWGKLPPAPTPGGSIIDELLGSRDIRMGLHRPAEPTPDAPVHADRVVMRFGRLTVESLLIMGTPPQFKNVIPEKYTQTVRVIGREFLVGLRRVQQVAKAGSDIVRLEWDGDKLRMSANAEETGNIMTTVPVNSDGEPGKVAVNLKFLLEYFKGKDSLVAIQCAGGSTAVGFRYLGAPAVYVMPMKVQWGDQAKKEPEPEAEPKAETETEPEEETEPGADEETEETDGEGGSKVEDPEDKGGKPPEAGTTPSRRGRKRKQEVAVG
jgi:DNA polymerase III subunit beta